MVSAVGFFEVRRWAFVFVLVLLDLRVEEGFVTVCEDCEAFFLALVELLDECFLADGLEELCAHPGNPVQRTKEPSRNAV